MKNRVAGITHLKTYADSDVEEDDDIEMLPPGNKTPERQQFSTKSLEDQLTPPTSCTKETATLQLNEDESETEVGNDYQAKRFKRTTGKSFSYLRRFPISAAAIASKRRIYQEEGIRTLLDDSSGSETEEESTESPLAYGTLKYMEFTGILRNKPQSIDLNSLDETSSWDRKVRIKISYRQRLSDNHIQFALIIYEHLGGNVRTATRRNLMQDFAQESNNSEEYLASMDVVNTSGNILVLGNEETTVATIEGNTVPTTLDISNALETASFTIVPLHTPSKNVHTPPATPKRRSRHMNSASSSHKRLNFSPSPGNAPKRSAARSLRL